MRKVRGYMTVEASLIMPMVICTLLLLIYFAYYLYGRCILSQDCYVLAFRAATTKDKEFYDDPEGYVASKNGEQIRNKYFGSERPIFKVNSSGKEVTVKGRSSVISRAMGRYFLKPKEGWDYMAAGKAKNLECIKHMRTLKRIKDIGEKVVE